MSEKSDFVCSFCLKILKNPINLPCFDMICENHLREANVLKKKCIECPTCKRTFNTDIHEFVPNKIVRNLLEKQIFLNEEEKSLKKSLEKSLQECFELSENYHLAKNDLDLKSHQHFSEIRFQMDLHREKLIEKIDEIYLEMIEKTKKAEATFLKNIDKKWDKKNILTIMTNKTFEEEKEEINEKFREKDLIINPLKEKQKHQEETVSQINSNINKMSQTLEDLKATNEFKPNSTSFEDQDSFGSLKLNDFLGNVKFQYLNM